MKTVIVADCLQQDVSILNAPKRMIFQNGDTTPKRPRIIGRGGLAASILGQQAAHIRSGLRSEPDFGDQLAARAVKIATTNQQPETLRETKYSIS